MGAAVIIPARYGSTRFPGKMLADRTGKPLIRHVVEQVRRARRVDQVLVATDDGRIRDAVQAFGGDAVLTRSDHACGTDRIAEAAAGLDAALILNVQGDEPEVDPDNIDRLIELLEAAPSCEIGTVACAFPDDGPREGPGSPADPNRVKVVIDRDGRALYFSRARIPHPRDSGSAAASWLLHLGIYGFRRDALLALSTLDPTPLERTEQLEQLRWLEHGYRIHVVIGARPSAGIDTPQDYEAFVRRVRSRAT